MSLYEDAILEMRRAKDDRVEKQYRREVYWKGAVDERLIEFYARGHLDRWLSNWRNPGGYKIDFDQIKLPDPEHYDPRFLVEVTYIVDGIRLDLKTTYKEDFRHDPWEDWGVWVTRVRHDIPGGRIESHHVRNLGELGQFLMAWGAPVIGDEHTIRPPMRTDHDHTPKVCMDIYCYDDSDHPAHKSRFP